MGIGVKQLAVVGILGEASDDVHVLALDRHPLGVAAEVATLIVDVYLVYKFRTDQCAGCLPGASQVGAAAVINMVLAIGILRPGGPCHMDGVTRDEPVIGEMVRGERGRVGWTERQILPPSKVRRHKHVHVVRALCRRP